jgi:hypothetical protein
VNRRLGALACIALVWSVTGCGGGDERQLASESGVRECLASAQIQARAPQSGSSEWSSYAPVFVPDLTGRAADGTSIAIVVRGSEARARQTAAHIRGALGPLGGAAVGAVIARRNVVAVFARAPSPETSSAVRSCLASA